MFEDEWPEATNCSGARRSLGTCRSQEPRHAHQQKVPLKSKKVLTLLQKCKVNRMAIADSCREMRPCPE